LLSLLDGVRAGRIVIKDASQVRSLLQLCASHKGTDDWRRRKRRERLLQGAKLNLGQHHEMSASECASEREMKSLLDQGLARLGPEAVQLFYLWAEGRSWADIGEVLQKTARAARARFYRLRRLLKKQLRAR